MTPRSFWTVLVKILGIYMLFEALVVIPQLLSSISQVFVLYRDYDVQLKANGPAFTSSPNLLEIMFVLGNVLMVFALYAFIFRFCIFKTDWIIDKLKLDKGYEDDRFEFNIHRSTVLKIAVIIIGGLMFIDGFPLLCEQTVSYFHRINNYKNFISSLEAKYIVIDFLKTFIGYFMLTCSRMIVNYIELKRKAPIEVPKD